MFGLHKNICYHGQISRYIVQICMIECTEFNTTDSLCLSVQVNICENFDVQTTGVYRLLWNVMVTTTVGITVMN